MITNARTDAELAVAAAQAGAAVDGQLVHTGAGGLIAAADRETHDALLNMIRN